MASTTAEERSAQRVKLSAEAAAAVGDLVSKPVPAPSMDGVASLTNPSFVDLVRGHHQLASVLDPMVPNFRLALQIRNHLFGHFHLCTVETTQADKKLLPHLGKVHNQLVWKEPEPGEFMQTLPGCFFCPKNGALALPTPASLPPEPEAVDLESGHERLVNARALRAAWSAARTEREKSTNHFDKLALAAKERKAFFAYFAFGWEQLRPYLRRVHQELVNGGQRPPYYVDVKRLCMTLQEDIKTFLGLGESFFRTFNNTYGLPIFCFHHGCKEVGELFPTRGHDQYDPVCNTCPVFDRASKRFPDGATLVAGGRVFADTRTAAASASAAAAADEEEKTTPMQED